MVSEMIETLKTKQLKLYRVDHSKFPINSTNDRVNEYVNGCVNRCVYVSRCVCNSHLLVRLQMTKGNAI